MTDKQIIEALKFCCAGACTEVCPQYSYKYHDCMEQLMKNALDLIKRKQERVEALEFLDAHRMYAVLGELEEYEKFYTTSDIKIGLRIAIDILKKGVFGRR